MFTFLRLYYFFKRIKFLDKTLGIHVHVFVLKKYCKFDMNSAVIYKCDKNICTYRANQLLVNEFKSYQNINYVTHRSVHITLEHINLVNLILETMIEEKNAIIK